MSATRTAEGQRSEPIGTQAFSSLVRQQDVARIASCRFPKVGYEFSALRRHESLCLAELS